MMAAKEPFRILITGARSVTDAQAAFVRQQLDAVYYWGAHRYSFTIVQGKCPYGGVDLIAERWADEMPDVTNEGHPADWDRYGKAAGPIRNQAMVGAGADLVMAFPAPGSRGTWDCLAKAVDAGIEPRLYPLHLHEPEATR